MKGLMFAFLLVISAVLFSSCASNKAETMTTTTAAPHQQGTGLPSQQPQSHGM